MHKSEGLDRKLFVGGKWVSGDGFIEVRSPYSGEVVGRVSKGSAELTRSALDAAELAMATPLPAHARAAILDRVADQLEQRQEEIARLICAEAGKPIRAARAEVARAASTYTFAASEARRLAGEVVPMEASQAGEGKLGFTLRLPIGIVAAISPFNFPLNLVAHKIAPALAAGCAVVLKPATKTPLSALLLAELEEDAGIPPGWLNVVVGPSAEIGDVLIADERVRAITFTGSAQVGWAIRERAPRKRVSLELGNATPTIVHADADLDDAAAKIAANAFAFAGQSCISIQRIYVQRDVYERFLESFLPRVEALTVGDPADEATHVGPVIDVAERERILSWIEEAEALGARILTGGEPADLLRPTVIAEPPRTAKVSCDEIFGPVCTVTPYDALEDAVALANGTPYGLQAGIFTTDLTAALKACRQLEFGGVILNDVPSFRADQMPYGGVKDSGNTREGPAYTVKDLTEERLVVLDL